ncbi:MAG: serine hydrolase [Gaiellaceae bacterium]
MGTLRAAAALALAAAVLAAPAAAQAPAWRPDLAAAVRYASHRHGTVAFAVRTESGAWGWHAARTFPSASVLKAMLLVAYLDLPSVRARPLGPRDRALLAPMIRRSDNAPAGRVLGIAGPGRLRALARRAGMRRFTPETGIWGLSRIEAADQARYFLHIDSFVAPRHRAYAMELLRTITPAQRWGIARVKPFGWRLYFKGGWGSGTGWVDHQVALLLRGDERVSIAILTYLDGSHAYGKETLRGVALRLLRGLAAAR